MLLAVAVAAAERRQAGIPVTIMRLPKLPMVAQVEEPQLQILLVLAEVQMRQLIRFRLQLEALR